MICQRCNNNPATVHLTEIVANEKREIHLCHQCAQTEGINIDGQIPINKILSSLLGTDKNSKSLHGVNIPDNANYNSLSCPVCSMTWKKYKETALLGCSDDYEIFAKPLEELVKKVHSGSLCHKGKVPSKASHDTKSHIELLNLKALLKNAVKKEDYETAAQLRDKIKGLKWN